MTNQVPSARAAAAFAELRAAFPNDVILIAHQVADAAPGTPITYLANSPKAPTVLMLERLLTKWVKDRAGRWYK